MPRITITSEFSGEPKYYERRISKGHPSIQVRLTTSKALSRHPTGKDTRVSESLVGGTTRWQKEHGTYVWDETISARETHNLSRYWEYRYLQRRGGARYCSSQAHTRNQRERKKDTYLTWWFAKGEPEMCPVEVYITDLNLLNPGSRHEADSATKL